MLPGTADVDGAQARGAGGLSDAQGVQVGGHSDPMDSGGIAGAGSQPGAAEDVGEGTAVVTHGRSQGSSHGRRRRSSGNQRKTKQ